MTYSKGEKIANRKLCVRRDLCHLLQVLLFEEMVKSEGRMEGCGSLRKRKAEIRTILIVQGLEPKESKAKWEGMHTEVETNGTWV